VQLAEEEQGRWGQGPSARALIAATTVVEVRRLAQKRMTLGGRGGGIVIVAEATATAQIQAADVERACGLLG
jgi:hypothetical protein